MNMPKNLDTILPYDKASNDVKIPQFKVLMSEKAGREVSKVLESGYISQGEKVADFEKKLEEYLDCDSGVTVNSGTSALWLSLHLVGVGPGTKVISTPMTCSATNEVISLLGGEIIWADIDEYGNIDPLDVALKFGPDIKAVMAVDWGGTPAEYELLKKVAGTVPIIEDAAHAFGARYRGESIARSGGQFACFSFQAIKHLTTGDGGFISLPESYLDRARLLRWFGLDRSEDDAMRSYQDIAEPGFKFHMNDIDATIGLANFELATFAVEQQRSNAKFYNGIFATTTFNGRKVVDIPPIDRDSSYWIYTIHVPEPSKFREFMSEKKIDVSQVHNRNDSYSCFKQFSTYLPKLDDWFSTMMAIPVGWWLSENDLIYISDAILDWLKLSYIRSKR